MNNHNIYNIQLLKSIFLKNVLGKIVSPTNSQKLPRWNVWNQLGSFCEFLGETIFPSTFFKKTDFKAMSRFRSIRASINSFELQSSTNSLVPFWALPPYTIINSQSLTNLSTSKTVNMISKSGVSIVPFSSRHVVTEMYRFN